MIIVSINLTSRVYRVRLRENKKSFRQNLIYTVRAINLDRVVKITYSETPNLNDIPLNIPP